MQYSKQLITWQGIDLEIRYNLSYCAVLEGNQAMAHIEVMVLQPEKHPLPITETGYKSHFIHRAIVEEFGGAIEFVLAWLDHESEKPVWNEMQENSNRPPNPLMQLLPARFYRSSKAAAHGYG